MMKPKPPKRKRMSPQEKKAASYKHDCRNDYGESDKSSRKNIPLSKAKSHRRVRLKGKVSVRAHVDDLADTPTNLPKPDWVKAPDAPLGGWLSDVETGAKDWSQGVANEAQYTSYNRRLAKRLRKLKDGK